MLTVYINYPNSRFEIHRNPACPQIGKMGKVAQRRTRIDLGSIGKELTRLSTPDVRFASTSDLNDLWLEIEFDDPDFEAAVVLYVKGLLGLHYGRLRSASMKDHCQQSE